MNRDDNGKVILEKEKQYKVELTKEERYKVELTKEESRSKVNLQKTSPVNLTKSSGATVNLVKSDANTISPASTPETPTVEPIPQPTQPPPPTPNIPPKPPVTQSAAPPVVRHTPPPTSAPTAQQNVGGTVNKGLVLLTVLSLLAAVVFWQKSSGKENNDTSVTNSQNTIDSWGQQEAKSNKFPGKAEQQKMARRNFSLGGVDIGDSEKDVHDWLGKELEITDPQRSGHLRYNYPDMEVVITNGRVSGFVSRTDRVYTKQGIHQGSTWQEVSNIYGAIPYAESEYDGAVLKEYLYEIDGQECLLRFAIKQGVVEYISGRTYKRENTTPAVTSNKGQQAAQTLIDYHRAITDKNFSKAMNLLSTPKRQAFRGLEHFKEGYRTTISSVLDGVTVAQERDNEVVLYYHITARDRADNGRIIVQGFDGTAVMIQEQGEWKIGPAESYKSSERWE